MTDEGKSTKSLVVTPVFWCCWAAVGVAVAFNSYEVFRFAFRLAESAGISVLDLMLGKEFVVNGVPSEHIYAAEGMAQLWGSFLAVLTMPLLGITFWLRGRRSRTLITEQKEAVDGANGKSLMVGSIFWCCWLLIAGASAYWCMFYVGVALDFAEQPGVSVLDFVLEQHPAGGEHPAQRIDGYMARFWVSCVAGVAAPLLGLAFWLRGRK